MRVEILGIPIDAVTADEAIRRVSVFLSENGSGRKLFTPNPEMLVMAHRYTEFAAALKSADLTIPDGVGLLWAAKRQGTPLPERVTGTDLMLDICGLAARLGKSVFLLGGGEGVAKAVAVELGRKFPGLKIAGAESGGTVGRGPDGKWKTGNDAPEMIRAAGPDILFVAFGHGKQEGWIVDNLPTLPSVRVAAGIGGAFDFLIGKARRAPVSWRKTGLEWLWRLITEPRRIGRIIDAIAVFPWLVITRRG
jgi:N-acetylglucosaminyldiphosphoundecaprenol N-acetyl-beta-D-mannosaminyltransferase